MPVYKRGKPLYRLLMDEADTTLRKVDSSYGTYIAQITAFLDAQFEVLDFTVWTLAAPQFGRRGVTEMAVISALHKNAFLFFSAIELSRRGLYGPACTLLRPILESLVIAKYCALAHDQAAFDKWRAGEHVSLTNEVLNKIEKPAIDEIRFLWKGMNQMAHATVYSQQISPEYEHTKENLEWTFAMIGLLLTFNFHLLVRHFLTPTTVRYTRIYSDAARFDRARLNARNCAAQLRKSFTKNGRQLMRECCANWQIRRPITPRAEKRATVR